MSPLPMPNVPATPRKPRRPAVSINHVSARLDEPTIARLDALAPLLTSLGTTSLRSIVLRAVILTGLDVLERQHAGKLPKR